MKDCDVCGAPGASVHYHGLVCHSCRVFFVRSIHRGVDIPCRAGDFNCPIVPAFRANCSGCRLKKCLEMKMRSHEVGKFGNTERAVVRYLTKRDYTRKFKEITDNTGSLGAKMISQLRMDDIHYFLRQMIQFERQITNLQECLPTGSQVNPNLSLAELLTNPGKCAPRNTAAWNTCLARKTRGEYSLIHLYSRMCVSSAEFIAAVPEFHGLSSLDMLKVAQYHIGHIGALDHMFYQWNFGIESANTIARTDDFTITEAEKACWKQRCVSSAVHFKPAVEIFSEIGIKHEEIMLLKLILVFYTPGNLSPEGEKICRSARAKYQSMLMQYILDIYPKMTKEAKVARLSRILDVFQRLRTVSEDAGQKYSAMIVNNVGGMRKQLPFEIRVKKYL